MNVQGEVVSGTTGLRHWAGSSIAYLAAGTLKTAPLASCCHDDGADGRYAMAVFGQPKNTGPPLDTRLGLCCWSRKAPRLFYFFAYDFIACINNNDDEHIHVIEIFVVHFFLFFSGSWTNRHVGCFLRGVIKNATPSSARC